MATRKLVHKQFNSPIGLYSQENVKETLKREIKAFGADGIEIDEHIAKPLNLANSAVLRAVEEEEQELKCGYKRVAWPPVSEERIVREFTPQPTQQAPPHSQQSAAVQYENSQQYVQPQKIYNYPYTETDNRLNSSIHQRWKPIQPPVPKSQSQYRAIGTNSQPTYRGASYDNYQQQQQQQQPNHYQPAYEASAPSLPPQQQQQYGYGYQQQQQQQPSWANNVPQYNAQGHHNVQPQYNAPTATAYTTLPQQQQQQQQQPQQYSPYNVETQTNQPSYNSYSQFQQQQYQPPSPQQQQQQQQQQPLYNQNAISQDQVDQLANKGQSLPQDYRGASPGIITLRKEAPVSQKPAPVYTSQPAAISFQGGSNMRGDLKWPPPEYKEAAARENEERRKLALGPVCRPRKVKRDYTTFFAKNALNCYYPSYKVPPGTQHMLA